MTPKTRIEKIDPADDDILEMSLEAVRIAEEKGELWAVPILQAQADERLEQLKTATRTVTQIFPQSR